MNVPPVVRRRVRWVDTNLFDGIDHLQYLLDLRPAGDPQQDVASRAHVGDGGARRTGRYRTQDVDAGHDGAEVIGGPADEGKDAARREGQDASATIEDLFIHRSAEANPVLDVLLEPQELNVGEIAHAARTTPGGRASCSRPGSPATHSCGCMSSVRQIPKESELGKLSALQVAERQGKIAESGAR